MSAALATAGLFALVGALFLAPLIPAFVELRLKRDAQALNVIQQYAGDIRHFSFGFRSYASDLLALLEKCAATGDTATGTLPHGDRYLLLGRPDTAQLVSPDAVEKTCDFVVAAGTDLTLPDGITFAKEMYASRQLIGGENCTYRAILGDETIRLGPASTVIRWAHAAKSIHADQNCDLYGRISSDAEIELQAGCFFQRLHAPRIAFGPSAALKVQSDTASFNQQAEPISSFIAVGRRLVDGDLEIPAREIVEGSIVTRGGLRIGAGAQILGSIKSNHHMTVDSGVFVAGSLISATTMHIGADCQIGGPVIAEHEMLIESGSRCGTFERPTTVSAPVIAVEEGVLAFGTIWGRQEGHVVAKP